MNINITSCRSLPVAAHVSQSVFTPNIVIGEYEYWRWHSEYVTVTSVNTGVGLAVSHGEVTVTAGHCYR